MNRYRIDSTPPLLTLALIAALACAACADDEPSNRVAEGASTAGAGSDQSSPFAGCAKGTLEADLEGDPALAGPGIDAETGQLEPGSYMVASTYLALEPHQIERALGLGGPVVESLFEMPGFIAFSTVSSRSCAALRTLTVWQSEEDMLNFVTSPAHVAAMAAVSELSRGSSNTVAWDGTEQDATWQRGAEFLARETGGDR